ncbi:MAG: Type secretory pathway VirD4 component-like protein [Flaviaesturariibacter sp.]|nr:Type secretory pathway VirD4 component-like protein [Flaviaesturariibacter sp.]
MGTGENEQGLRKILDMTRWISLFFVVLHCYYYCYAAFAGLGWRSGITDRLLSNLETTKLFVSPWYSKAFGYGFLLFSLIGTTGKKEESLRVAHPVVYLLSGTLLYFLSSYLLEVNAPIEWGAFLYGALIFAGYILVLTGGVRLSRVIRQRLSGDDIFNSDAETFPQEARLLQNEYSVNLPARYRFRGRVHRSWINLINPFRGVLVLGSPGSGKSYFVIRHILTQHLQKGFSLFVYDFKFDDLTRIAYNHFLKHRTSYAVAPEFYIINFDDLSRTHRCNPLDPRAMSDITDATESARTILMGLNREWVRRQGDFFVESPINFVTAVIWFLRRYRDGEFCTLPHVIELMQVDYDDLFSVLRTEKEIEVLINPFINAYLNDAMEQLEGQIAAAKIAMARLASPQLYYVLSGNDFTLDINNPEAPKIVCMGNNPQKQQIYGAVLSLYVSRLIKLVNRKGGVKSSLIFDEFPTIYLNNMDGLIATARSNKVATTLGVQDFSQLKKDYGRDGADVIMNITGNIISGQVMGETAKSLSERLGKIMQDRTSFSINRTDTSVSHSRQLEAAMPPSKIASLSSGEFVGLVADEPGQKIELKAFHCEIVNDHATLKKEADAYQSIPVIREVTAGMIQQNYWQVKGDIEALVLAEMELIINDPAKAYRRINKA